MKKIATILMLMGLTGPAMADVSEVDSTYFHPAASLYIHGDTTSASNLVAQGLAQYPDNGKLKALMELIEKQQNQDQQNQDQKNQDQKDQQEKDKEQQEKDQQDQQQDQEKDQQDQQQDQEKDQQDQQSQQQAEPRRAEQMSKDEAEQLLDAMKQDEKNKRLELHPILGQPVKVDKDW